MQSTKRATGLDSLLRTTSKLSIAAAVAAVLTQAAVAADADTSRSPDARSTRIQLAQSEIDKPIAFDIKPQPMSEALTALGAQSGLSIIVETEVSKGLRVAALSGRYTPDEALKKLLEPAGLKAEYLDSKTVAVRRAKQGDEETRRESSYESHTSRAPHKPAVLRLAQAPMPQARPAAAEHADWQVLDEVIVTAQKRAESIMDVPLSITALTAGDLEALRAQRVQDFAFNIPNLSFASVGVGGAAIVLRGTNIAGGRFSPIAITVDDASFGGIDMRPILESQVFDVERIEVLRGPQGTLTGSNSLGGTINIITARPDPSATTLKGTLDYGRFNSLLIKAVANVPLSDTAAVRLVGYRDTSDGAVRNIGPGGGRSDRENAGGRISTRWEVTDRLEIGAAFGYEDLRYGIDNALYMDRFWGGEAAAAANRAQLAAQGGIYYDPAIDFVEPDGVDGGSIKQDIGDGIPVTNLLGSAYVKYDFGSSTLQLLYGHFEHSMEGVNDIDLSEFAGMLAGYHWDSRSDALELRLTSSNDGPLNWVLGVTYGEEEMPQGGSVDIGDNQYAGSYGFFFDWQSLRTIETQAVFGNLFWDMTSRLHLSAGGRFTRVRSMFGESSVSVAGEPFPEMDQIRGTVERFDPRVAVSFDLSHRTMLYAQYATGFRPGYGNPSIVVGTWPTVGGTTVVPRTVDNEYASNYEVGFKTTLFNGRAGLAAALFHMDYEDLQVRGPRIDDPLLSSFSYDINAGSGRSRGFELELAAKLTDALQLNAGVGYVDAELKELPGQSGRYEAPGTRPWTANLSGVYERGLFADYRGRLRLDYRWQAQAYQYLGIKDPATELPEFGVLNLSAAIATDRWDLSAYFDNVTDENYWVGVAWAGLRGTRASIIPRTYGLRFTFNFGADR